MAKTLEQILGYVPLTGTIQRTKTGLPMPLPEGFLTQIKPTLGNTGRYVQVTGQRRVARFTHYGAPAQRTALKDIASKDVVLLHSFEEQIINPMILQALRQYNNYDVQRMGMEEVARQVAEFKQKFVNLRVASTLFALFKGNIWADANGAMLPSSSGAKVTVDYGMSANNQNQLNGTIATSWALPNSDIPGQLRALRVLARRTTGYPLRYAFYGKNVPKYLTENDLVIEYLSRNPVMQNKFMESAELPAGLFDFVWVPAYEAFYEDESSTNQSIVGDDAVVFTPEVDQSWYEMMEGTYPVPTTINLVADAAAAVASLKPVQGMFGYSAVLQNPPTICSYFGDTFLPVIKVPDAIYQAVVAF